MSIKDIDPYYYSEDVDEDGNYFFPCGGYWLQSADSDRDKQQAAIAVQEGRACWLEDAPDRICDIPF